MRALYGSSRSAGHARRLGKFLLVPACLAALSLAAVTAQAQTVVTFDDLTGTGIVADGYGGINWGGVWSYYDSVQPPYTAHSDPERVYTPSTGSGEYTFTFLTPQVFDGAWFAGQGSTTLNFNLYDASNNLLATSSSLSTSAVPTFLDSGYSGQVSKVGVFSNANDFYVMDDVTYGAVASTPEPGSIAMLLGMGLTGAGFLLKKRRR